MYKTYRMEKDTKIHDVVSVLESFGKFHWIQYFLGCLPSFVVTLVNINFVFTAGDLDYRCKVPECDTWESSYKPPPWWPNTTIDKCSRPLLSEDFLLQNGTCNNTSFSGVIDYCNEWIYESNNTIVAELNLACQPWKVNLVGTIHNMGMIAAMMVAGWLSDRIGRKPTLIFCAMGAVVGHLKPFAESYSMYVAVEFLEATLSGGTYLTGSLFLIELSGKKYRVFAGVLISYVTYLGECVFAGLGWLVPYWKNLIRIINTPSLFFFCYIFLIRESPRWQVLNGKSEQAKKTLEKMAEMNGVPINKEELRDLSDEKLKLLFNIKNYEVREGYKDIFNSKEILIRLSVASFARFTCGFVYYGLIINAVLLPGNKYTNLLLSTVMSFPGELVALYLMNKCGRKIPLIIGYLICGVMCIVSGFIPGSWPKIACFLLGKMFAAACFTGIITYTMELYPTSVRGSLLGFGSVMSRTGAMLAPLTPVLLPISAALPTILFGGTALLTSVLLTITPETKDLPLLDTIEQVNASVMRNKKSTTETSKKCATEMSNKYSTKMNKDLTTSFETVVTNI